MYLGYHVDEVTWCLDQYISGLSPVLRCRPKWAWTWSSCRYNKGHNILIQCVDSKAAGPLFTKRTESCLNISWSIVAVRFGLRLFQLLRNLRGASAVALLVQFQSVTVIITSYLASSRLHESYHSSMPMIRVMQNSWKTLNQIRVSNYDNWSMVSPPTMMEMW